MTRPTASNRGLSLLGLLVTLTLAAVLLGIGAPALLQLVSEARVGAAAGDFVHAVHLARQAAQVRGLPVVLHPDAGPAGGGPGDWSQGWLVFVNADRDEPPVRDAGEAVLLRHGAITPLRARANRRAFTFRPFTVRDTNGSWEVCADRPRPAWRRIVISATGRPRNASGDKPPDFLNCDT